MTAPPLRSIPDSLAATLLLMIAAALLFPAWLRADGAPPYKLQNDVAVRMRDGVILRADLLLPAGSGTPKTKFPVLIYRTPYGKQFALPEYKTFEKAAARGYAVLIQDVRGRYASDGEFLPYQNEGHDGYDTIEWAAVQPWCDGNVGTFGLSYPGAVQWLAAVETPPHLKAMVPAMTFSTPRNFFYSGGVFDGSWLDWIFRNIAPDARRRRNLAGPKTYKEAAAAWKKEHERIENFLPLRELPDLQEIAPFYYTWLAHPPEDVWWDWAELRNKYDRVHAAVLNISGWYDEAYGPDGATTNYNGLLAARRGETPVRTRTIIGPWTHGGQKETKAGEREFPANSAVDYDELILRWMDHFLRGVGNGVESEAPVRLFVMGRNIWRDESAWPLAQARATNYFLAADKTSARAGSLEVRAGKSGAGYSEFSSDPKNPLVDPYRGYGAHDYRKFAGRDDVLVFDTEALTEDTEISGPLRAEIYLSADVRDLDLWIRILDVAPDGTAFNLMSPGLDVLRASHRIGSAKPELLAPGRIYRMDLERMLTSNCFLAGHKIRVQISGAFSPHFSRNLQTGKSEISSAEMQAGHIRIYHDQGHASRVVLPVVPQ
ncbi:MAG TPA: CocE/NonD family hydrolase [Candidatus Saccharimonadales bacterium]|nr:CocE/NonD family hydrolase [Candidatus Saccharimonadales bacterium]